MPTIAYHPGLVAIYDTSSGILLARIQPDPSIAAALHLGPPALPPIMPGDHRGDTAHQVIGYSALHWSPDGTQLAVAFGVVVTEPPQGAGQGTAGAASKVTQGVLLTESTDARPRVLSHVLAAGERYSGRWNLVTGAYIPPPAGIPPDAPLVAPGLNYTWARDGSIVGHLLLQSTSTARTLPAPPTISPVGMPDGGAPFSTWQPATLNYATVVTNPRCRPP